MSLSTSTSAPNQPKSLSEEKLFELVQKFNELKKGLSMNDLKYQHILNNSEKFPDVYNTLNSVFLTINSEGTQKIYPFRGLRKNFFGIIYTILNILSGTQYRFEQYLKNHSFTITTEDGKYISREMFNSELMQLSSDPKEWEPLHLVVNEILLENVEDIKWHVFCSANHDWNIIEFMLYYTKGLFPLNQKTFHYYPGYYGLLEKYKININQNNYIDLLFA